MGKVIRKNKENSFGDQEPLPPSSQVVIHRMIKRDLPKPRSYRLAKKFMGNHNRVIPRPVRPTKQALHRLIESNKQDKTWITSGITRGAVTATSHHGFFTKFCPYRTQNKSLPCQVSDASVALINAHFKLKPTLRLKSVHVRNSSITYHLSDHPPISRHHLKDLVKT